MKLAKIADICKNIQNFNYLFLSEFRWHQMLRRMGYITDQKGIYKRYLIEKGYWKEHLNKCRQFIIENLPEGNNDSVAVLGSGWLLDVPIEFLHNRFRKVFLFDVFHPHFVRKLITQYPNLIFIEQDISGGAINESFQAIRLFKKSGEKYNPEGFRIAGFSYTQSFDCVISINLLNQLDILATDYLRKYKIYSEEQLKYLSCIIQQKHIDTLPKGKSILITDFEEVQTSMSGQELQKKLLVHINLPETIRKKEWQWKFDSHGNYHPNTNVTFNVRAITL